METMAPCCGTGVRIWAHKTQGNQHSCEKLTTSAVREASRTAFLLQEGYVAFALAHNLDVAASAIYYGRWHVVAVAAVDDDVHHAIVLLVDELGVGGVLNHFVVVFHGSGEDRVAQLAHNLADNVVVGYAYADGFLVALQQFGHIVVGLQDESERAGQPFFHRFEDVVGDGFGVVGEVAQAGTDEGHGVFLLLVAQYLRDSFYTPGFENIAADTIDGVGRIDDDATLLQAFHHLVNRPLARILWIYFQYHKKKKGKLLASHRYNRRTLAVFLPWGS